ncbi:MAG: hypothetical protein U0Q07_10510 [Acidimicrobiales bacterium]
MRWEYLIIDGPADAKGLAAQLNRAGADGWEVVSTWMPRKGVVAVLLKRLAGNPGDEGSGPIP